MANKRASVGKSPSRKITPVRRRPPIRTGTVSEIYNELKADLGRAEDLLKDQLRTLYVGATDGFSVAVDDVESSAFRRGTTDSGNHPIDYASFGPPPWFEAPYIVLALEVNDSDKRFMTHGGEEILYNLRQRSSDFRYEFFWREKSAPWHTKDAPWNEVVVEPGSLVRINSSILHRNSLVSEGGIVRSWIILRPLSLSPAAVMFHLPKGSHPQGIEDGRKFEKEELDLKVPPQKNQSVLTDAQLLMISSGLLEKIRIHRLRADLTYAQFGAVLKEVNLSPNYISRLERRELENFSVSNLFEIAKQLDIELLDLVRNLKWAYQIRRASPASSKAKATKVHWLDKAPDSPLTMLQAGTARFTSGSTLCINLQEDEEQGGPSPIRANFVSVVATQGQLLIDLLDRKTRETTGATIPLKEGHVFHARDFQPFRIEGRGPESEVLIILCKNRQKDED